MHKFLILICSLLFPLTIMGNDNDEKTTHWGDIDYDGEPWVKNISYPAKITHGLQGRHLSLWASHGTYYDQREGRWRWQRPKLFATTEDLFTQTIVVPYLIPMLENAGAVVFTPRERDWQKEEIIVDNDGSKRNYIEVTKKAKWQTSPVSGFMYHLMEALWQTDSFVDENTLTVNVGRLRRKLDAAGLKDFIVTKHGEGYLVG